MARLLDEGHRVPSALARPGRGRRMAESDAERSSLDCLQAPDQVAMRGRLGVPRGGASGSRAKSACDEVLQHPLSHERRDTHGDVRRAFNEAGSVWVDAGQVTRVWRQALVHGKDSGRPVASSRVTPWLSGIIAHHKVLAGSLAKVHI
jgi:hypothetical protein